MGSHHRHEAYLGLMGCFVGGLVLYGAARRRNERVERPLSWSDVVLLGVATHKISRIVAKDRVTSPIRAPFEGAPATSQADDANRRNALGLPEAHPLLLSIQNSVGELVTCPYCLAPWVSLTLHLTHFRFPQLSRAVGSIFVVVSISDFINRVYGKLEHA